MTSKVSIALATFNGERFLQEQLDSLAGQSLQPFELVVSDDCSSDGTLRILQQFKQTTKFPMIINQNSERLGYRHNFRRALQHCTGDLIAFCDQDDVWYANKLERTVPLFDNPRVMMVYHNAHIFDNSSGAKRLMLDASHENQLLAITPFPKFHFSAGLLQIFRTFAKEREASVCCAVWYFAQGLSHATWWRHSFSAAC